MSNAPYFTLAGLGGLCICLASSWLVSVNSIIGKLILGPEDKLHPMARKTIWLGHRIAHSSAIPWLVDKNKKNTQKKTKKKKKKRAKMSMESSLLPETLCHKAREGSTKTLDNIQQRDSTSNVTNNLSTVICETAVWFLMNLVKKFVHTKAVWNRVLALAVFFLVEGRARGRGQICVTSRTKLEHIAGISLGNCHRKLYSIRALGN